mgnify:CR=1 FL=1
MRKYTDRIDIFEEIQTPAQAERVAAIGASYYTEAPVGYGKYHVTDMSKYEGFEDENKRLQAYMKIAGQICELKKDYNKKDGYPEGYVQTFINYFDTSTLDKKETKLFHKAAKLVVKNSAEEKARAQAERVRIAKERRQAKQAQYAKQRRADKKAGITREAKPTVPPTASKKISSLEEFRKVIQDSRERKNEFKNRETTKTR